MASKRKPDGIGPDAALRDKEQIIGGGAIDRTISDVKLPRLERYYADPKMKPGTFIKAVRVAKLKTFDPDDLATTLNRLAELDPTFSRTVAFVGKQPAAISQWVIEAAKTSLASILSDALSDRSLSAAALFDRAIKACSADLASKDRRARDRAQNLLRLALVWLIAQRNLSPIDALLSAKRARKKKGRGAELNLRSDVSRLLVKSKLSQLLNFALVANLFEVALAQMSKERREALAAAAEHKDRIAQVNGELVTATERLESATKQSARLHEELASTQKALIDEKELRSLERTKLEGRFRRFLTERLGPPLSDARDVLGFDPPNIAAALQRIEMTISAIEGERGPADE